MANAQGFVSRYREYGGEQAHWKVGIFKIRLPFIHYAWSIPLYVRHLSGRHPCSDRGAGRQL